MSGILPISSQTMVWNESAMFEKGITFLVQKKQELKIYQDLWDENTEFNSPTYTLAPKKLN